MRSFPLALLVLASPAAAQLDLTPVFDWDLRYRTEVLDDDRFPEDGVANTLRGRLGVQVEPIPYLTGRLQVEHVQALGPEDYNDGTNDRTAFPRIPDPQDTDIGELFLRYDGVVDTSFVLGRQKIVRGNARIIGNAPWRQLERAFDAFSVDFGAYAGWRAFYAYIANVRQPFGGDSARGDEKTSSHLAEVTYSFGDWADLTAYAYYLDFEENLVDLSTLTTGARFAGGGKSDEDWSTRFEFELARQTDAADNPGDVNALYYGFESGASNGTFYYRFGWQSLGGGTDGVDRFTTPMANLTRHNGIANQFTNTPGTGLEDLYIGAGLDINGVHAEATYHDFDAETGSSSYGDEIDLKLWFPTVTGARIGLAAAFYDADSFSVDLESYWIWIEVGP